MDYNDKPNLDELAHFGVKGMRWGHRKPQDTSGGGAGSAPPKSNRQLNKEFRKDANAKRDAEIETARANYNQNARQRYLSAKAQYKQDKKTIGSAAARAKFNEVKQQNIDEHAVASQAKSGKETTIAVLGLIGGVALVALSGARR